MPTDNTIPPTGDLFDVPKSAAYLFVSEAFVRKLVSQRRIRVIKVGRAVRIRRSDLDAYLDANTREAVR